MPAIITATGLGMAFDAHPLFEDLTIAIEEGSHVGLIGPNGAGKSTLLAILAGQLVPDSGELALMQGTRLVYLPQQDRFAAGEDADTVLAAAMAEAHPQREEHQNQVQASILLDQAGFGRPGNPASTQAVDTLSGGWRKRVAILRALAAEPDLLLIDEPTNHLDLEGIWWLEGILLDARFTYVVVSHDRFFLERVCGRVVEINRLYPGGCFSAQGGYSTFLEKRAERVANQQRQQASLENKVRQEIEWLRRNPAAQTIKSKARIDVAHQMIGNLADLRYRNAQDRRADLAFSGTGRRANELVSIENVAKARGGRPLFAEVELILAPGTRLGVHGLNGSGKTTFLQVLAGTLAPDSGRVHHINGLRILVYDQRRERLDPALPLKRALCPDGKTVVARGRAMAVQAWAKRFLFSPAQLDLPVGKLSGGEQARACCWRASCVRKQTCSSSTSRPTTSTSPRWRCSRRAWWSSRARWCWSPTTATCSTACARPCSRSMARAAPGGSPTARSGKPWRSGCSRAPRVPPPRRRTARRQPPRRHAPPPAPVLSSPSRSAASSGACPSPSRRRRRACRR